MRVRVEPAKAKRQCSVCGGLISPGAFSLAVYDQGRTNICRLCLTSLFGLLAECEQVRDNYLNRVRQITDETREQMVNRH